MLNNNQGVIGVISIIITIIGFFIIDRSVNNSQNIKSGDSSKNNMAGRDIITKK